MRTLTLLLTAMAAAACGVSESNVSVVDSDATQDGAELSATSRTYVMLRHDQRRCVSPLCGGFWVHDVNRATVTEVYVNGLDFSASGLTEPDQAKVTEALGEVVLRGKLGPVEARFGTRPFVVSDAWRGLPGKTVAAGEAFYKVKSISIQCIRAPCPSYSLARANSAATTLFHELKLDRASAGFIDPNWLDQRSTQDGALVAGALVKNGEVLTLDASNMYLKLPEVAGPCPMVKMPPCASGTVRTYVRTADRCVVPSQCVTQGVCTLLLPHCGDGYTNSDIVVAPRACHSVVCEPSWVGTP